MNMDGEFLGYFDDDGTEINPDLIPKPSLCLVCKKNEAHDWEEEMLCNLNRMDQRNDEEFRCFAFEQKST